MKLSYDNLLNKHKDLPCVISCHGPSLNRHKAQIETLQKQKKVLRFSMNEWYDFFEEKPDYWIVSNSEFTIKASMTHDPLWSHRGYPYDVFNLYDVPLLYNTTADLSTEEYIKRLNCDYMPYDTRHFKGHNCQEILDNFRNYVEKNKNLNFKYYGNNLVMWSKPQVKDFPTWFQKIHGKIAGGWSVSNKCCGEIANITLQEKLQQISGYEQHMGPGHTVGIYAIIYAVLMGCNPIYIAGMDLDYSLGYAEAEHKNYHIPNIGNVGHWKKCYKNFLIDDMRILNESARLLNTKIVNLNKNSWYDVFEKGDLLL